MHSHSHEPLPSPQTQSPLHRLPASLKLLTTLALIITLSLLPPAFTPPAILILIFILILIPFLLAIAKLPLLNFSKRLILLEPFVLSIALLPLFSSVPWPTKLTLFAFLLIRCTLALALMLLFTSTTPFSDLLRLFRKAHLPALLLLTLALMHRYLFVLADESARMRRARQSRTFTPKRRFAWHTTSTIISQLFLRASQRADRIYDAMCARGYK